MATVWRWATSEEVKCCCTKDCSVHTHTQKKKTQNKKEDVFKLKIRNHEINNKGRGEQVFHYKAAVVH